MLLTVVDGLEVNVGWWLLSCRDS